jgi:hypothetical protein
VADPAAAAKASAKEVAVTGARKRRRCAVF